MINKIKIIIKIFIIIFFIGSIASICLLYKNNKNLKEEVSIITANQKAFISENSSLKEENRVFKFTVEQLNYYNDSILQKMNEVTKELKIKDNNLKQMQYLLSKAQRVDTLIFTDTLFINSTVNIDTMIKDDWYQLNLGLRYPNTIIANPSFISEKYIVFNYKKETINPPKKCAIARWFQKKHKVVEVNVIEKNPYIENKQQKFIEIIK
jgi:hypothetical protein